MNGKSIGIAVAVVVVLGGGYMVLRPNPDAQPQASLTPTVSATPSVSPSPSPTPSPTANGSVRGPVKTFEVKGLNFSFDKKDITVNKGDTVRIVFTNTEGFHDWVIDEFNAKTPRIQAGQSSTIEFVADKTGSFQYYCSVGAHRAQGMWGTLVVK